MVARFFPVLCNGLITRARTTLRFLWPVPLGLGIARHMSFGWTRSRVCPRKGGAFGTRSFPVNCRRRQGAQPGQSVREREEPRGVRARE